MPATYEPISSSFPSGASSVEFNSIPGNYTDLVIVYHLIHSTGADDMFIQFNSDTGTNYSTTNLYGTGSVAGSYRQSNQSRGLLDFYAVPGTSAYATNIIQIMSYANTNVFKTVLAAASRASSGVDRNIVLWRSTSAITTIRVFPGAGTITGSMALYGIKAA